jgi:transcriptional regulator with XRE-family HTH domain
VRGIKNQKLNIRIKHEREKAEIPVPVLAEKLGLSDSSVYRIDTGSAIPSTERIVGIASILKLTVSYLLGVSDVRTKDERYEINLRLKELREQKNLSRPALSTETEIPAVNFAGWESGKTMIRLDAAIILSDYFDVSLDYFLGLTDVENWTEEINQFADVENWADESNKYAGLPVQVIQNDKGTKVIRWGLVSDAEDGIIISDGQKLNISCHMIKKYFNSEDREKVSCPVIRIDKK